jgi:hypothetical protein
LANYAEKLGYQLMTRSASRSVPPGRRITRGSRSRARRADVERELAWIYGQQFRRDVTTQLRAPRRQLERIDAGGLRVVIE